MASVVDTYFNGRMAREFTDLMLGEYLGCGVGRMVHVFKPDPKYVIKFETAIESFQNVREWDLWRELEHYPKLRQWLAPIKSISPGGDILIQARTTPMKREELPAKVPAFATDLKIQNWGLFEGRPVMHDYGFIRMQALSGRPQKAKWWGFVDE